MGILDGIVEWIAEQVMNILDLITTSVLGALGCSMDTFLRYFPAAETMYQIFLALAIGLILLNWVWQLFKNYFMGTGIDAEDPIKLSLRAFMFLFLASPRSLLKLQEKKMLLRSVMGQQVKVMTRFVSNLVSKHWLLTSRLSLHGV